MSEISVEEKSPRRRSVLTFIGAGMNGLTDLSERLISKLFTSPLSALFRKLDALSYRLEGTWLRWAVCVSLFPLLVTGTLVFGFWLVENGVTESAPIGTLALYIVFGLIFAPLERLFPFSRKWLETRQEASVDIMILVTNFVVKVIKVPLEMATILVVVAWLSPEIGQAIWPSDWNPVVQVFLLLTVKDFFNYWYHRAMHEIPFLWRWHAVHHSSEKLYWFNGKREHPLEGFIGGFLMAIPLAFVQAPAEIVFVTYLMIIIISRFQHTNVDVKMGFLNYIFSAPKNHRYHHSKNLEEGNANYGGDVMIWDHLFGTFHMPKGKEPGDDIGIGGMPNFPRNYMGLMLAPFIWQEADYMKERGNDDAPDKDGT